MWKVALSDAGVAVETVDAHHLRLRALNQQAVVLVRRVGALTPARVPPSPAAPGLLIAPDATSAAISAALAKGWNVAADSGKYAVKVGRDTFLSQPPAPPQRKRHPGPASWALLTVARRLLGAWPQAGAELALRAGISQSRASRVLAKLVGAGIVQRGPDGYRPVEWRQLLDWWLANYPGPGGVVSYWASTKTIGRQTQDALGLLAGKVAVSGDPAADILSPWRIPTLATVYAERARRWAGQDLSLSAAPMRPLWRCAPPPIRESGCPQPGPFKEPPWRTPSKSSATC
ncbi:MAG: hypothetical protein LBD90_05870 [Bifidobacteriaceae bacterium]|nr:hypothetical protein [Bifidobacteriaceae bacterium]